MLFGVSDGIQDITRRSGIVQRIRFIYGKSFSGLPESSGFFGIVPEVLEGSGGYHSGAHLSQMTNMDQRGSHRPTWARHSSPPRPMWLDQVDKIKSLENRDLTWGEVFPLVLADPRD